MADRTTPFICKAWYVFGTVSEISREPMARIVLGASLVAFRNMRGEAIVLGNRCAHRSFPLVHGRLDGDTLVCGYHGLRYDCSGQCIEVPMQSSVPATLRVRAYPVRELGDFVWVWMGDRSPESVAPPLQDWMGDSNWDRRWGYLHLRGSYVHLHENLLDLSHLSFLHATTFGTPEYARAPVEMKASDGHFEVWRHVECKLPDIYAKPLGWVGEKALRSSGSLFVSPALHVNTGVFRNLTAPDKSASSQPMVKVAQLITPETQGTTHYWTLQARNFARGDPAMGEFMIQAQLAAFREDAFALERISEMQDTECGRPFQEVSIPTDKAGVLMRRHLLKLATET